MLRRNDESRSGDFEAGSLRERGVLSRRKASQSEASHKPCKMFPHSGSFLQGVAPRFIASRKREPVNDSLYCDCGITAPLVNGSYCTPIIRLIELAVNNFFHQGYSSQDRKSVFLPHLEAHHYSLYLLYPAAYLEHL